MVGFNNIELITDRPLEVNLREIREVKRKYPDRAVIVSLMVESKEDWRDIIKASIDTGCDGLELNFGCPHGMCERGMGSAVGTGARGAEGGGGLGGRVLDRAGADQAHAQHRRHPGGRRAGGRSRRARAVAHQHHQEPDRRRPRQVRAVPGGGRPLDQRRLLRPGGQADRAPHGGGAWRAIRASRCRSRGSAASPPGATRPEFIALGSTSVQVCTGRHALRLPHRRGHDRRALELPRRARA